MNERLIRLPEVVKMTGLSKTTIWRYEKKGEFPKHFNITVRTSAWRLSEIQAFINKVSGVG